MKKSRFTEEQIIAVLKTAEAGKHPTEVCRENGKLKRLVATLSLDCLALKDALSKNW